MGQPQKKPKKKLKEFEGQKNNMKLVAVTDERGDIQYQEVVRHQEQQSQLLMIRMNDQRKVYWEIIIIFFALYNCLETPIEIAFEPEWAKGNKFFIFQNIVNLFFFFDMIVAFRTTFYDLVTGDEVYNPKRSAIVYLKGQFFIDFISTVPFDTLGYIFAGKRTKQLYLFSCLKLIRVTRLSRIIARLNVNQDIKNRLKLF